MGSAALNWVLKDGLGRCGAIAAASVIGNKFDNDSKTYFLLGDVRDSTCRGAQRTLAASYTVVCLALGLTRASIVPRGIGVL
jgi:hypothetical protein